MKTKEVIKRYFIFLIGLACNSFGVAFTTKASLGASPIASIPYSLSLCAPRFTMGNYVIMFNLLMILIQWMILRSRADKRKLILQVIITFIFGYCTDFSLAVLADLHPSEYYMQIISLLIGCCILGLGVFFELIGNVGMLPGNAISDTIANALHKEYGKVRMVADISMTLVAAIISLVFLHRLESVREGTVIAAFLVGNTVTLYKKILRPLEAALNRWITAE